MSIIVLKLPEVKVKAERPENVQHVERKFCNAGAGK